jgi:hypothetical protein
VRRLKTSLERERASQRRAVLSIDIPSTAHSHHDTPLITAPLSTAMEHFFLPFCLLRYQDILDEQSNSEYDPHEYTDIQLAVPVEDFLVYRWDWKDLRAFLTGGVTTKMFWITEDAFLVVRESGNVHHYHLHDSIIGYMSAKIQAKSGEEHALYLAHLHHPLIPTGEISVFWRAITTSNSMQLSIHNDNAEIGLHSGPLLSHFLRESPSLQVL